MHGSAFDKLWTRGKKGGSSQGSTTTSTARKICTNGPKAGVALNERCRIVDGSTRRLLRLCLCFANGDTAPSRS